MVNGGGSHHRRILGSLEQTRTHPTNAVSLLIFSTLLAVAAPNRMEFIIGAGLMAVMDVITMLIKLEVQLRGRS